MFRRAIRPTATYYLQILNTLCYIVNAWRFLFEHNLQLQFTNNNFFAGIKFTHQTIGYQQQQKKKNGHTLQKYCKTYKREKNNNNYFGADR